MKLTKENLMSYPLAVSLLIGLVFGIMTFFVGGALDFGIGGMCVSIFVFTSVLYLILDFKATFFEDDEA
jgi:hypothetical protein